MHMKLYISIIATHLNGVCTRKIIYSVILLCTLAKKDTMATGVIQHFQLVYVNIVLFPMFQII